MRPPGVLVIDPPPPFPSETPCRRAGLWDQGIDFAANEGPLHGGTSDLGSAKTCPQFESVVVLRDAAQRARSHVGEVDWVYAK